jgi:hypothetical protein
MSEPTVSFRSGVIEQQKELARLREAVKGSGARSAAAWLPFLRYKHDLLRDTCHTLSAVKQSSEWTKLAELYSTALKSLHGTPQDKDYMGVKAGKEEALR